MTRTQVIVLLLALCFSNFTISQDLKAEVDRLYQVEQTEPGFSIAVYKGDKIVLEKQYGSANLDYDIPITEATVFDIGSIAKQFTAFAILLLEERKQLSITEPAYTYLEELPRYPKGDPTIEQLLNQTSGIREVDLLAGIVDLTTADLLSQSQMINLITKENNLNFKPGDYFQYTNSNYVLLAQIIATVSGKSFAEFMEEDVFEAFGMKNTVKKSSTSSIIKNRAIGYIEDEGAYYKTHLHSFIYHGDGQILTTPRDMFQWHMGLKEIKTKYPGLYTKMHTKARLNNGNTIDYGLGVEFETHNGHEAFGFDGMIKGGFVSKYLHFPALDLAFFTTQNTFDWDFTDRFFQLVDLYVPKKDSDDPESEVEGYHPVTLTERELKHYEGDYLFVGSDDADSKMNTVKTKGDELAVLTLDGDEITRLTPLGNHEFLFNDKRLVFDLQADQKRYAYYNSENELPWLFTSFSAYSHTPEELKAFEGHYFNKAYQISKKVQLEGDRLYFYYRNGAWKDAMEPLAKDLFELPFRPAEFIRNDLEEITGLKIMGIVFEKL